MTHLKNKILLLLIVIFTIIVLIIFNENRNIDLNNYVSNNSDCDKYCEHKTDSNTNDNSCCNETHSKTNATTSGCCNANVINSNIVAKNNNCDCVNRYGKCSCSDCNDGSECNNNSNHKSCCGGCH